MKAYDMLEVLATLCCATGRYGMFLNLSTYAEDEFPDGGWLDEVLLAVPWLSLNEHTQIIADGYGYFLFDSEEELNTFYNQVRGDDPNEVNPYDGPVRVYALTAHPDGLLHNENT